MSLSKVNLLLSACCVATSLKGRLHDRAKMARIRQKLEGFQQFLQRNSKVLFVPQRVHRRLWTRHGTDKTSLFLCKNCWNRSSFCRIRAIFALSCKRPFNNAFDVTGCYAVTLRWFLLSNTSDKVRRVCFSRCLLCN